MESGDGAVVVEAVVAADDAEAEHVSLVVENIEALGAGDGRHAGHHADLAESADGAAVADDDVAALQEMLVRLRVVEAADQGPHGLQRGCDLLHHRRAALVRPHRVDVVLQQAVRHQHRHRRRPRRQRLLADAHRCRDSGGEVVVGVGYLTMNCSRHISAY